jgi:hypothetical protein
MRRLSQMTFLSSHRIGHLAARRRELVILAPLVPVLVEQRHRDLLERETRLLDREPAAQRPGGIGLVADDELEHVHST